MKASASDHNDAMVTETNGGGYIAICECGWTSLVHRGPAPKKNKKRSNRSTIEEYSIGKESALTALRAHQFEHRIDDSHAA
jgi:hypothetical protein